MIVVDVIEPYKCIVKSAELVESPSPAAAQHTQGPYNTLHIYYTVQYLLKCLSGLQTRFWIIFTLYICINTLHIAIIYNYHFICKFGYNQKPIEDLI